jgi:hypothetical protein
MKYPVLTTICKSLKFAFTITCIMGFLVFLGSPTIFGIVLVTSSAVAIAVGYGIVALIMGLVFNGFRTFIQFKRESRFSEF